jgi:hypothetical protein
MREVLRWYQGGSLHVWRECSRPGCGGRHHGVVHLGEAAFLARCVPHPSQDAGV